MHRLSHLDRVYSSFHMIIPFFGFLLLFSSDLTHADQLYNEEIKSFGYIYISSSLSYDINEGISSIGFGEMITDPWGRYGFELGLAFPWWRNSEMEPLLGFEGRIYWATGGAVAFIAGVGALLATDLWFDPFTDENRPEAPDDGSSIAGVVALLPSIGILLPSTTAIQLECAFRPIIGLATEQGAFIRGELSLSLRGGGIF